MAKKVRTDGERKEEKKAVFEPPEFDEAEFLKEEIQKIKVTLFFILLSIPFGVIGAIVGIQTGNFWPALGVAIFGMFTGYLLAKMLLGVDLLEGQKRQIIVTLAIFFMAWLAFSILFSNPPFADSGNPTITDVMVYIHKDGYEDGEWEPFMYHKNRLPQNDSNKARIKANPDIRYFLYDDANVATIGDNVSVLVRAADPGGLKSVRIAWNTLGVFSSDTIYFNMTPMSEDRWGELDEDGPYIIWGEHYYERMIPIVTGDDLYFRIEVEDEQGNVRSYETKTLDTIEVEG